MSAPFLQLHAVTRRPRTEIVPLLRDALVSAGGWVTDYRQFSNKTVCLMFELEESARGALLANFRGTGCVLEPATLAQLESPGSSSGPRTCQGTLVVTLVHEDPDEHAVIHAVPG